MSLDKNLFTLSFTASTSDPSIINLVDPEGAVHYTKQRASNIPYEARLYDPISQSLLVTATAPNPTNKTKTLTLHNPTTEVLLKYVGTLTFKWAFTWGEHEFEWRKSECYLQRKPDPPVLVAVTKDTPGRLQFKTVQILDYNINRFDIDDRKGLEIVLLITLLTFQDYTEGFHAPPPEPVIPPVVPPKPKPKVGIERLREIQMCREEYNQILVEAEGTIEDYGQLCSEILQDDALLFITLRSASANEVQKVLLVVEETKRIRHKSGLYEGEELEQYVLYDTTEASSRGPKRINLNDPPQAKDKYAQPQNLTVHLSKISMPELQPREGRKSNSNQVEGTPPDKKKGNKEKRARKDTKKRKNVPSGLGPKPPVNKLGRPGSSHDLSPAPLPQVATTSLSSSGWMGNRFVDPQAPLPTPPPPPPTSALNQFGTVSGLITKGLDSLRRR